MTSNPQDPLPEVPVTELDPGTMAWENPELHRDEASIAHYKLTQVT